MEATTFLPADKELLIRVVKDCQKSKLQGTQGSWKDYLKAQTPALSKSDPSMHSSKVSPIQPHTSRESNVVLRSYYLADVGCFYGNLEQTTGWHACRPTQGTSAASEAGVALCCCCAVVD